MNPAVGHLPQRIRIGTPSGVGDVYWVLGKLRSLREQHKSSLVGGFPDVGGVSPYEGTHPEIKPFAFGTGMHDDKSAGRQDYGSQDFPEYYPEENPGV